MKFTAAKLPGVWVVDLEQREDERGFLARTYCDREFAEHGLNTRWPQSNLTHTKTRGMVRGLHFQREPQGEIKLLRCIRGAIWDVALDVRRDSPSFGQWEAFELSAENRRALYLPKGIAHGLQCLNDDCEVFYQMGDIYAPQLATGIRWNDPALGIQWPIQEASVSDRDANLPFLSELP